jgi:hypothetical protein
MIGMNPSLEITLPLPKLSATIYLFMYWRRRYPNLELNEFVGTKDNNQKKVA